MRFEPDGLYIDDLLSNWKYQYDILEENHNYIQWLFPLREVGRNSYATPLHEQEIEMMKNDEDVKRRLREAYKFMLQFYGLQLLDENSGIVGRAENWQKRYWNLDRHSHNNLRITRILKCLGDLGYEHYQGPLIKFFLEETLCYGNLQHVKKSVLDYFLFSVRDKNKRKTLVRFAWENYEPKDQFIWGPVEVLRNDQRIRSKRTLDGGSNNVVESNEEISCSRCCVCVSI
ncbi:opioid growth factor receptor-like [Mantella aurantiaca]